MKIERWRESTQVAAQVKTLIDHSLQWLPQETYPDEEVDMTKFTGLSAYLR